MDYVCYFEFKKIDVYPDIELIGSKCGYTTTDIADYKKHNHKKLTCVFCGKKYWRASYKNHLHREIQKHNKEQYKCKYCEKPFDVKKEKTAHEKNIHEGKKKLKMGYCEPCDIEFPRHYDLQHQLTIRHRFITGEKAPEILKRFPNAVVYNCDSCPFITPRKHLYKRHIVMEEYRHKLLTLKLNIQKECEPCNFKPDISAFNIQRMRNHLQTKKHYKRTGETIDDLKEKYGEVLFDYEKWQ